MNDDARFEDGGESPLRLVARDGEDLQVLSTLVQDAVFPVTEMSWSKSGRRFAILLNRFRWEDRAAAERRRRPFERVQSVLTIEDVESVATQGVTRDDPDMVLALLSVSFEAGEDGTGAVLLTLAGDGAIRVEVEALEVMLADVTRPYVAPSRKAPHHPD